MHAEVNLEERMTTTTTVDRKMIKLRQKRERKNGGHFPCLPPRKRIDTVTKIQIAFEILVGTMR